MIDPRAIALASLLVAAGASQATAQFFGTQRPQPPNICESFTPIRLETESNMAAVRVATERKAPREEFCQLFTKLSGSMAKMSKFLEQHQTPCNVPPDAIQKAKAEYNKVLGYRKQACNTTAPSGPRLSDVLGAPLLPESSTAKPNDGIFNTMTGSPLTR
jgi:hypothetical protein